MKIVLALLATALLGSTASAQSAGTPQAPEIRHRIRTLNSTDQGDAAAKDLGANYRVTFALTDDTIPIITVSVMTAQRTFTCSVVEQSLTVSGSLELVADGAVFCTYTMQWAPPKAPGGPDEAPPGIVQQPPRVSSIQGSVRAPNDKDIEVFRAGSRSVKLSVKKLDDGAANDEAHGPR